MKKSLPKDLVRLALIILKSPVPFPRTLIALYVIGLTLLGEAPVNETNRLVSHVQEVGYALPTS